MEAAERLVVQVEGLREWLLSRGFIRLYSDVTGPYAATGFAAAYGLGIQLMKEGGSAALHESGLSDSAWSVLAVAANLSGTVENSIRYSVTDLDAQDAQLVAEAFLYAVGYLDARVDVHGNEVNGKGPNLAAHQRRVCGEDLPGERKGS